MNKVIRIVVAGLSLCGVLAVLPGVAEAREPERPAAVHPERERGHEGFRGHEGRWDHRRGHDGRGWRDARGVWHRGC